MAKTLGRRGGKGAAPGQPAAASDPKADAAKGGAAKGDAAKGGAAKGKPKPRVLGRAAPGKVALTAGAEELVQRLAGHTGLLPGEVLERALAAYAAAVAPTLTVAPAARAQAAPRADAPAQRVFLSVDGKPEIEVGPGGITLGRDPGCDLVLELSLLSPRHARVIPREGRWIFEDLRSARGSYRHGEKIDVRFLEDGDEIDLAGFLPLRVRLG